MRKLNAYIHIVITSVFPWLGLYQRFCLWCYCYGIQNQINRVHVKILSSVYYMVIFKTWVRGVGRPWVPMARRLIKTLFTWMTHTSVGPSLIPRPSLRETTSGLAGSCCCVEALVVDRRNKDCVHWILGVTWASYTGQHGVRSGIDPINQQEKHSRKLNVQLAKRPQRICQNNDVEPQTTWIETRREYVRKFWELWTQIPRLLYPSRLQKLGEKPRDRESGLLQETIAGNIGAPIGNAGWRFAGDPLQNWTSDSNWWS